MERLGGLILSAIPNLPKEKLGSNANIIE